MANNDIGINAFLLADTTREVIEMEQKNCECRNCINGVCCTVASCKHHAVGDLCTATHINVKSEDAITRAETFCGTFTPVDTWQYV